MMSGSAAMRKLRGSAQIAVGLGAEGGVWGW